ncbi:MAG TPA: hypothetical protein VGM21_20195 [Actinomycetota bacterium]|jgi:hypothetical protein
MGGRVGSWLLALLVVGAIGVGGVLVAGSGGSRRPPVLELAAASGSQPQATAGGDARDLTPAQASTQPYWPKVRYELPERLPDLPGEARAWRLVPRVGDDQVAALARALGFSAKPVASQGSWRAFQRGRLLQVTRDFGAPWTYAAGTAFNCATLGDARPGPVAGSNVAECPVPAPAPVEQGQPCPCPPAVACRLGHIRPACRRPPPRPVDLPSREQAERIAREWLTRASVPLGGSTVRTVQQWNRWVVTASSTVGGMPTIGDAAEVWVGAKGEVVHGNGWLSEPQVGATYPLIGVKEALDRLRSRRVWFGRWQVPVPQPCPADPRGVRCAQPETVRRITDVRLGLQHTAVLATGDRAGRDAWLVPAYLFQIDGDPNQVESVIAVADRYLRTPGPSTPAPTPVPPRPVPIPSKPSSAPGGPDSGSGAAPAG